MNDEDGFTTIFLHIPKTAGTTFYNLLVTALNPTFYLGDRSTLTTFLGMPQAERDRLKFIYGHMPYGAHRFLSPPVRYMTFLREPIDRVVSAYYHCWRWPGHPLHRAIRDGMSLTEYTILWDNNRHTRQLGGAYLDENFSDEERHYRMTAYPVSGLDLQIAKERLADFYLVGLYEEFAADVRRLFTVWDLSLPEQLPKFLQNDQRPPLAELSPVIVETIAEHNRLDIELYRWATAMRSLNRRLSAH